MSYYKFSHLLLQGKLSLALKCSIVLLSLMHSNVTHSSASDSLPLLFPSQLNYIGGFRVPSGDHGDSRFAFTMGKITMGASSNRMFITGHSHHKAIAEIEIPELVNSTVLTDLNKASVVQDFVSLLDKPTTGNVQGINVISGMEYINGSLLVNGFKFYDANNEADHTTLVVKDANDLAQSDVSGWHSIAGKARMSGWISEIPTTWRGALQGTHIFGNSSGSPIIIRHSVGPSLYTVRLETDLLTLTEPSEVSSTQFMDYPLQNPMGISGGIPIEHYLHNRDLEASANTLLDPVNNMWNHLSVGSYGFIVPGTRTYAVFGKTGGHRTGVQYKITQDNQNLCGGYCAPEIADYDNYYWLFDLNQILSDSVDIADITPYAYGKFEVPFQTKDGSYAPIPGGMNPIKGGAYDAASNILYLLLYESDTLQGGEKLPVIVAYEIDVDLPVPPNPPLNLRFE